METAVGAVILASGVVCPPFNDTECIQVRISKMYCRVILTVHGNRGDSYSKHVTRYMNNNLNNYST